MTKEFSIQERTYSCFFNNNFNYETRKEIISRTVGQTIDKFKKHWKFEYYVKDGDYTILVNFLVKQSFSYLLENFNELDAGDLFLSNIEYEIIQFMDEMINSKMPSTEDDISIILKINDEIKRQIQTYAHHEELVETGKSTIIMWGNACACWNIIYFMKEQIKKGNTVQLDASMVLVPYPRSKVNRYLCLLDQSPLYKYSFEAVYQRGETPFLEGVVGWMAKTIETEEYKKMQEKYA